eukprot:3296736-Prymnesium_polylepis.1
MKPEELQVPDMVSFNIRTSEGVNQEAHHRPAPQPRCDVLDAATAEDAADAGVAQQPAGGGRDG